MSKGLGEIQREVRNFFRRRPYAAITAEELCRRVYGRWKVPTRAQKVALVRSVKRLAETYPVGYMEAARRGRPLVFYRTDNEVSSYRAEGLCQPGNDQVEYTGLPWSCLPPKPEPQGYWRPTATPGAIAAVYKYLLQKGKEPTAEAIAEFYKDVTFREGPVEVVVPMMLSDLHSRGHLDRIRAEVNGSKKVS
jgi:hypothetical protein